MYVGVDYHKHYSVATKMDEQESRYGYAMILIHW